MANRTEEEYYDMAGDAERAGDWAKAAKNWQMAALVTDSLSHHKKYLKWQKACEAKAQLQKTESVKSCKR